MNIGSIYSARECRYNIICSNDNIHFDYFPYLRDDEGLEKMYLVSPEHGRSYLVSKTEDNRYIVSKGNGLSYSKYRFLNTGEMGCGTWGLMLKDDAIRDYNNGILAGSYGIITNRMHCVIELEEPIIVSTSPVTILNPVLLQYDVACPYRISDAPFISKDIIHNESNNWCIMDYPANSPKHVLAADTLIRNLKNMHDHGFLHNAITVQNYTWALELLDFEMATSPEYPYEEGVNSELIMSLFNREILHTYQIIVYIANVLNEKVDYGIIDNLFYKYGMDLRDFFYGNKL